MKKLLNSLFLCAILTAFFVKCNNKNKSSDLHINNRNANSITTNDTTKKLANKILVEKKESLKGWKAINDTTFDFEIPPKWKAVYEDNTWFIDPEGAMESHWSIKQVKDSILFAKYSMLLGSQFTDRTVRQYSLHNDGVIISVVEVISNENDWIGHVAFFSVSEKKFVIFGGGKRFLEEYKAFLSSIKT